MDGATLAGLGSLVAAIVGIGTWLLTRRALKTEEGSTFVDDALKLQQAAQSAYDDIESRMAKLVEASEKMREEMNDLRLEFQELKREVEHWKSIAFHAREAYTAEKKRDPYWWKEFDSFKEKN